MSINCNQNLTPIPVNLSSPRGLADNTTVSRPSVVLREISTPFSKIGNCQPLPSTHHIQKIAPNQCPDFPEGDELDRPLIEMVGEVTSNQLISSTSSPAASHPQLQQIDLYKKDKAQVSISGQDGDKAYSFFMESGDSVPSSIGMVPERNRNKFASPIFSPLAFNPQPQQMMYRKEAGRISTQTSGKDCLDAPRRVAEVNQEHFRQLLILAYLEQQGSRLGSLVGKGVSSQVYALVGRQEERVVKILNSSIVDAHVDRYNPHVGEHLALILNHPNILSPDKCLYLVEQRIVTSPERLAPVLGQVSRYCKGKTLEEHMEEGLSEAQIRHFSFHIACGLSHLHAQNVIHGDVHPGNVLIENKIAYLTDFGLSHQLQLSIGSRFAKKRNISSSPERLLQRLHTKKADSWSFGVLLYQLLHQGNFPFSTLQGILSDNLVINPNIPQDLKQLLNGLLDRNPETRLSMYEVRRILHP